MKIRQNLFTLILVLTITLSLPISVTWAQDAAAPADIPIEFIGTVESVDAGLIIVDQLPIDITQATSSIPLQAGHLIRVKGKLQSDGSILAEAIEVMNETAQTATLLPQTTPSPAAVSDAALPEPMPLVVLEGAVEAVNPGGLTVNGLNFIIDQSNPLLTTIRTGDLVRIEGLLGEDSLNIVLIPTNVRIDRNTPPPAAANVQPPANPPDRGNDGRGMGMGMGDDDDDDGMGMGDD